MPETETIVLRILLSMAVGGIVGAEREYASKDAGLRTLILISIGSCLFTMISIFVTGSGDRIASNIVTGIGFLGAGVIFKEESRVKGLTTAATVWAVAALGMAAGAGFYKIVLAGTVFSLISLYVLTYLEDFIERTNQTRNYRIMCDYKHETLHRYEEMFRNEHLRFKRNRQSRIGENIMGTWSVSGSEKKHNAFIEKLMKDESVREFDF